MNINQYMKDISFLKLKNPTDKRYSITKSKTSRLILNKSFEVFSLFLKSIERRKKRLDKTLNQELTTNPSQHYTAPMGIC